MTPKTTGILAVIAVLLGAFVYFIEIGGETTRKAEEQAVLRIFPDLEANSIEAIEFLTLDGIQARFERSEESGWELPGLGGAPADATALDGLASALANLSREGRVEDAKALEPFGLDDLSKVLRFEVAGRSMGLRVGNTTPVGGFVYVAPFVGNASLPVPEVSFVESFRLNPFRRNLLDLRERQISGSAGVDIDEIELRWPGSTVELVREGEGWQLRAPVEDRADDETVRELLNDLSFLRANGFVDEPDAAAEDALRQLAFAVRWTESGQARQIEIGGAYADGVIVRGPSGRLATIPAERLEDFERSVPAYRDRTLASFDLTQASRLEMTFVDSEGVRKEVTAKRQSEGWEGGEPAVDSLRIASLVGSLSNLRAQTIVAEELGPGELEALGLAPARVEFRVRGASDDSDALASVADVSFGRLMPERGFHAQRAGDPKVYLVEASVEEDLPTSWEAYLSQFSVEAEEAPSLGSDEFEEDDFSDP